MAGRAPAEAVRFEVDHERSSIAVRTDKGGLLSAFGLGHKHGILATEWSAEICFDSQRIPASSVAVSVSAPSLRIDTSEARSRAGLDPKGPSPKDVEKIQQKMLSSENLAADVHPDIRFQSTSVELEGERTLLLRGSLTVRGRPRTISLPVTFEPRKDGRHHFSGQFRIKQSGHGIKPESIGGVVNVKDEVVVYLDIHAVSTMRTCR